MKLVIITSLSILLTFCAGGTHNTQAKTPEYIAVAGVRASYHLTNYLPVGNMSAVTQTIFLEMHDPAIYGILLFRPDGRYIDGFLKDESGKINRYDFTADFKEPVDQMLHVKRVEHRETEIAAIKIYYK